MEYMGDGELNGQQWILGYAQGLKTSKELEPDPVDKFRPSFPFGITFLNIALASIS